MDATADTTTPARALPSEWSLPILGALQLQVMRYVWDRPGHQQVTVLDVSTAVNLARAALYVPLPPLAYTTLLTVMRNLSRRKYLDQRWGDGRAHVFTPLVTRHAYRERIARFALAHCEGNDQDLVDRYGRIGASERAAAAVGIGA
jgi:predicted transcriptional regulator